MEEVPSIGVARLEQLEELGAVMRRYSSRLVLVGPHTGQGALLHTAAIPTLRWEGAEHGGCVVWEPSVVRWDQGRRRRRNLVYVAQNVF